MGTQAALVSHGLGLKCLQKCTLNIHNGQYHTKNRLQSISRNECLPRENRSRSKLDVIGIYFYSNCSTKSAHYFFSHFISYYLNNNTLYCKILFIRKFKYLLIPLPHKNKFVHTELRYSLRKTFVSLGNFLCKKIITYKLAINVHLNRWCTTAVSPCGKSRLKYHLINI